MGVLGVTGAQLDWGPGGFSGSPVHPWGSASPHPPSSWLPHGGAMPSSAAPQARQGQNPLPSTGSPLFLDAQEEPVAPALGTSTGCVGSSIAGGGATERSGDRLHQFKLPKGLSVK